MSTKDLYRAVSTSGPMVSPLSHSTNIGLFGGFLFGNYCHNPKGVEAQLHPLLPASLPDKPERFKTKLSADRAKHVRSGEPEPSVSFPSFHFAENRNGYRDPLNSNRIHDHSLHFDSPGDNNT